MKRGVLAVVGPALTKVMGSYRAVGLLLLGVWGRKGGCGGRGVEVTGAQRAAMSRVRA